jgi:hypothetical protein
MEAAIIHQIEGMTDTATDTPSHLLAGVPGGAPSTPTRPGANTNGAASGSGTGKATATGAPNGTGDGHARPTADPTPPTGKVSE